MNNKVIKNASWIVACKIGQSLISFIIGLFTARYLGPSNFGLISYATSIVSFFLPIMRLGLNSTLVQELLDRPDSEGEVLGTALVLNILSASVSVIGVITFVFIANKDEPETMLVCFLYSLMLLFQTGEALQYWFQAKLLSKYPSLVALIAYIIVSIYKIFILVTNKDISWFAITHVFEVAITSLLLIIIYKKAGGQKLSCSLVMSKQLFSRSKYYISSSLIMVFIQQTDRVMLKAMIDESATGFYSAAFTCVGITGFVFMAIIDSMRPYIIAAKNESSNLFQERLTTLFAIITIMSVIQGTIMTLFAKGIVFVLFGEEYQAAVGVLQILSWQVLFAYYGTARNIWMLIEEKQSYLWKINLSGAILNIVGNMYLIPLIGASGAALASVLTQLFINFVLCFVLKPMQPIGKIILHSWNIKIIMDSIHFKREKKNR